MLLTVSNDKILIEKLEKFYTSCGVFSMFCNFENVSNFVNSGTDFIKIVIIDARNSRRDAMIASQLVSSISDDIRVTIIKSPSSFIELHSAISSREELSDLLDEIAKAELIHFCGGSLKISPSLFCASLLGYPLKLTPSEHRILLSLSLDRNRIFTSDELCHIAFPLKSVSKNQLAVHVSSINKKAISISERKLILNPHKNGYVINESL